MQRQNDRELKRTTDLVAFEKQVAGCETSQVVVAVMQRAVSHRCAKRAEAVDLNERGKLSAGTARTAKRV